MLWKYISPFESFKAFHPEGNFGKEGGGGGHDASGFTGGSAF